MTFPKKLTESSFLLLILLLLFVTLAFIFFNAEASFDSGDGIRHYLISRYSWNHPNLLLDSWGKPFFSLISSPFSQFGFYGIVLFNIGCGIFSAFFAYKTAKALNYKNALLTPFLLVFTPIYFLSLNSGLTEPLFGLLLIVCIYLMVEKKYMWASILISFIPFVRTEGFLFLPLFFIVLIYYKSYIPAFLLSLGTILYSFIGLIVWGDFLWIKNQNPYTGSNRDAYGSGEFFHFAIRHDYIWGGLLTLLLAIGILIILFQLFFKIEKSTERPKGSFTPIETILILGCFIVYFLAHSFMWWKGLANSMGLVRVFAGVTPCSALICLKGFNFIVSLPVLKNKIVTILACLVVSYFVIIKPFQSEFFPFQLNNEQLLVKEAADWMKEKGYEKRKIYYLYPYLPLLLNLDAFDDKKVAELWALNPTIKKRGLSAIPDGTIIFWDAHFGPNECGIPLDSMMNNLNFDLLKSFFPPESFKTLGDQPFTIRIFEKRKTPKMPDDIKIKKISSLNFDLYGGIDQLNKDTEYGKGIVRSISDFNPKTKKIVFTCEYLSEEKMSKDAMVVLTIDQNSGKNVFWLGKSFVFSTDSTNTKIGTVEFDVSLDAFKQTDILKVYIWNIKKAEFAVKGNKINCLGRLDN